MAFAEYLQLTRKFKLAPIAGAPANAKTLALESGTPYRHYIVWAYVAGGGTINVDFQPRFANANDGSVVNVATAGPKKVFAVPVEEMRPATRGYGKHPDDDEAPMSLKSEVVITNKGTTPVEISVFMLAAAAPGGT